MSVFDEEVSLAERIERVYENFDIIENALKDFENRLTQMENTVSFLSHNFYARYSQSQELS